MTIPQQQDPSAPKHPETAADSAPAAKRPLFRLAAGGVSVALVLLCLFGGVVYYMAGQGRSSGSGVAPTRHFSPEEPRFDSLPAQCLPKVGSMLAQQFGAIGWVRSSTNNNNLDRTEQRENVTTASCQVNFGYEGGSGAYPEGKPVQRVVWVNYYLSQAENAVGKAQDVFQAQAGYIAYQKPSPVPGEWDQAVHDVQDVKGTDQDGNRGALVFRMSNLVVKIVVGGTNGTGTAATGEGREAGNRQPIPKEEALSEVDALAGALASSLAPS